MDSEYRATLRTERIEPVTEPITGPVAGPVAGPQARRDQPSAEADPLAKVTLTPRQFAALVATIALLLGLLLAVIPVPVAGPDPASNNSVSCGNTIGGAETDAIAADLGAPDRATLVAYVGICERAISDRTFFGWPLFFGGGLVIIYLGVVRRPRPALG